MVLGWLNRAAVKFRPARQVSEELWSSFPHNNSHIPTIMKYCEMTSVTGKPEKNTSNPLTRSVTNTRHAIKKFFQIRNAKSAAPRADSTPKMGSMSPVPCAPKIQ